MSVEETDGPRSVIYQDLIDSALESEEPVTDIDEISDHRTVYRAAQEVDGTVWRADIDTVDEREEYDSKPSVSFARCHPDSDVRTMRKWSSLATGRLSGPQKLHDWEALFTVFNAALGVYNREVQ